METPLSISNDLGSVVETADGTLSMMHPEHGESYHSRMGARREAVQLYMEASGFIHELRHAGAPLNILDVGLGLGYNALATIQAWTTTPRRSLVLTSLEINPDLVEAFASGAAPWQSNWPLEWRTWACSLRRVGDDKWEAVIEAGEHRCTWRVWVGDARGAMPIKYKLALDYIWQDPFSPKKNPLMWDHEWFGALREQARGHKKTTLVTYSVARVVKDALAAAGWDYEIMATGGPKSSWLRATPRSTLPSEC